LKFSDNVGHWGVMGQSKTTPAEAELDLGRYELRRSGRRVKLEKKPMELLIFLAGRREQLVSREEIARQLWRSDLFIDIEKNLNNIVRKLRTALHDHADRPRFLETVVGKGYRFVGPLKVIGTNLPRSAANHSVTPLSAAPEHCSIAILPLVVAGKAADDQGISLGFADALVARLGNLPGLDVLPTSAALSQPAEFTPSEIASRLGVRFVVHGAIQMVKNQWRLSLEMFDAHSQRASFTRKCDLDLSRLAALEAEIAAQIASTLNRRQAPAIVEQRPRFSRDPLAYAEFMRGYRITASGDASKMDRAAEHLSNAVARDPAFALAHATLSFACATRHFEFDPANAWLEKAEFHCRRALELDPNLAEGHVARAFLVWGPSKNFQHLEAIAGLKRALSLQSNLPHGYNRLGTILAHIGLLDHAREMFERGRPFQPGKAVSPSIVQVYVWNLELNLARQQIVLWRAESPSNKYPIYFAPLPGILTGDFNEAVPLMDEALRLVPNDPIIVSLQGLLCALMGDYDKAQAYVTKACSNPKSFGHAHHTYYQIAGTLALMGNRETAFEWLERSVATGFACWPFFLKDPSLAPLHRMPEFELLISSLQAKYPDHLGEF
jgi:DNA-binding winged helix-turn-helix (wHTH) protein/tetratricopeptide (TPR) repeat protein